MFTDETERPSFGAEKLPLGVVSQKTQEYLTQIASSHESNILDYTNGHQNQSVINLIFYFKDLGYLSVEDVGHENILFWYPEEYQFISRTVLLGGYEGGKLKVEIVETENFNTPFFIFHPDQITVYCTKMARRGYFLFAELEHKHLGHNFNFGERNNDFFKII